MRNYHLSAMTGLYYGRDPQTGLWRRRLDMGRITRFPVFESFDAMARYVLESLRFPIPQADKFDSYALVPALFEWSANPDRRGEEGIWRAGEHESDHLSCHYADVDNKTEGQRHISEQDIADRLTREIGPIRFFTYTSFTSRPDHRKFRVMFDTDREVTRWEMRRIHLWMQERVLLCQGDDAILDDGDMIFAPPHACEATDSPGRPLPVDRILALATPLESDPDARQRHAVLLGERRVRGPQRDLTPEERAGMLARIADATTREDFAGIDDPEIFNPAWRFEVEHATSHYATMLSALGRVWKKAGGRLSRGEMQIIYQQIDSLWMGYMERTYPPGKDAEMIGFVMSNAVVDDTPRPQQIKRDLQRALRAMKGRR